jgi:hypothetical protein
MSGMSGFVPPGECPVCGCDVPAKAKACPECGACATTGWNEDSAYDGLDLPSPEADQTWEEKTRQPRQVQFLPITITIIVLLIFSGIWFLF